MESKNNKTGLAQLLKKDKVRNGLIVLGLCGIVLIYLSTLFSPAKQEETTQNTGDLVFSAEEYEAKLEKNLVRIVSAITGEESPEIMVTLGSTSQYVYASDEKKNIQENEQYADGVVQESQNSSDIENNYIILKDANGAQHALKVTEIQPEIKGVVVVSAYAEDVFIQEKIINAMKTALNISSAKVCVLSAK